MLWRHILLMMKTNGSGSIPHPQLRKQSRWLMPKGANTARKEGTPERGDLLNERTCLRFEIIVPHTENPSRTNRSRDIVTEPAVSLWSGSMWTCDFIQVWAFCCRVVMSNSDEILQTSKHYRMQKQVVIKQPCSPMKPELAHHYSSAYLSHDPLSHPCLLEMTKAVIYSSSVSSLSVERLTIWNHGQCMCWTSTDSSISE